MKKSPVVAPSPKPRAITTVLALSGTVVALMQTLVVPLLPDFPKILEVNSDDASWLVTATLLASAVATPIVSRSADMYGKRKMMAICLAIMVAGSVMAAIGGTFLWVIIGRALQGFSAALIPVGISIMRDELPKEKMGTAVALMSATLGIGSALGLPLAGLLYESLGWTSIFWVSTAAGTLLFAAVMLVVPESRVRTPGRFDYVGALVLSGALGGLLLAISKGGSWGWTSEPVLLLFAAAALLLAAWVPYELRARQPMVDLRTSARRPVLLTNVSSLLIGFAMFANMLLTTQQLQIPLSTGYGFELNVITAGLCMVPSGLAMVLFAPVSGLVIRRFGGRAALLAGAGVMIIGYVGRVFLYDSVAWVVIGSTIVGVGTAIAYAAMPTLIMGAVPITETASANGLNSLVRSIGTSMSSAAVGAVLTSVTMTVGSTALPSLAAFQDVFWMAAAAAAASALAALFIPGKNSAPPLMAGTGVAGLVVQGRVQNAENLPLTPAVVTALHPNGEPVDWNRADSDGRYSIALPTPGTYLIVANAAGWAPVADVLTFRGHTPHQDLLLRDRLELTGTVNREDKPVAGSVVTLLRASGEHVNTTTTGADGVYTLPLPASGRYIVAVFDPTTQRAAAQKVVIDTQSATVDFPAAPQLAKHQLIGQ